jgi:hypothetical protein
MSLAVDWTKHLKTQQEKDKFSSLVVNNRILLGRLLEVIDEKLDVLERAESNQETYQNPAYASWQAHVNGKRASLKEVRRLLEFLEA